MIQLMLEESSCSQTDLSSFKGLLYGGSPIAPPLLRKAMEIFGCEFFQIYGLTETGIWPCVYAPQIIAGGSPRMKAAGRPLPASKSKSSTGKADVAGDAQRRN